MGTTIQRAGRALPRPDPHRAAPTSQPPPRPRARADRDVFEPSATGQVTGGGTVNRSEDLSGAWVDKHGRDPNRFDQMIREAAQRHGVSPRLLKAMIQRESQFDPNARSGAGARGLMQVMPRTWRSLGGGDPTDARTNIDRGAKYIAQMLERFDGNVTLALAAYNAGPTAVSRAGGVPRNGETPAYVRAVLAAYEGTRYA